MGSKTKVKVSMLALVMILGITGIYGSAVCAQTSDNLVDSYIISGEEVMNWRDHTGSGSKSHMNYSTALDAGDAHLVVDFQKNVTSSGGNYFTQFWTPGSIEAFLAGADTYYISLRIKPSEPTGTQTYETAITLGEYHSSSADRVALFELLRFNRNGKIVLGGIATQMEYSDGTEAADFSYDQWYTFVYKIENLPGGNAALTAEISEGETVIYQTDSSNPFEIEVPEGSKPTSFRFNTYFGYSGNEGDSFSITFDYLKLSKEREGVDMISSEDFGLPSGGGYFTRQVTVKNFTENEENATLMMGIYKSGGLLKAVAFSQTASLEAGGTAELTAGFSPIPLDADDGDYIKAFLWNRSDMLMPHTTPVTTDIIGDVGFHSVMADFEAQDAQDPPPNGITVFTGSSSVRRWDTLSEDMSPMPVLNRGFGGSQAYQAVFYFERNVLPYNPKQVVFYEGDNDINNGKSPQQFLNDCMAFADKMREKLPDSKLYFLSIKPSPKRMGVWDKMAEANTLLEAYADEHDFITYIDVASALFDTEGDLIPGYFHSDDLHLSSDGYAVWQPIVFNALYEDYDPE